MTRLPADSERVTYVGGRGCTWEDPLEVHPSTTAVVVAATGPGRFLHRQVRDERFGRQDRGDILDTEPGAAFEWRSLKIVKSP